MLNNVEILENNLECSPYKVIQHSHLIDVYASMNEYARQVAIDFFNWQKKDYAECSADMSVEEWFDKYISSTSKK